jgi:hypothetical protein
MTCAGVATPSQSPDGSTTKPLSIDGQNGDANTLAAAPRAAVDGGGAAAVATIAAALGSAADTSEQDMRLGAMNVTLVTPFPGGPEVRFVHPQP